MMNERKHFMVLKRNIPLLAALLLVGICSMAQPQKRPADYVDNRIGTFNDGSNCVIGPQLPFGSINPSPQTRNGEHDGYNPDEPIRGFGQLHVSGTGWGHYGQILVSPQIGLSIGEQEHDSPKKDETAKPYEYGVTLSRYGIHVDFTPSAHSAIYRFVFPKSEEAHIAIDLSHSIPRDIATQVGGSISKGSININPSNNQISGYGLYSGGFGHGEYPVFFSATFSKKPSHFGTWKNGLINKQQQGESISAKNDNIGAFFNFSTEENDTIYMKIGISLKSIDRAEEWLSTEIGGFDYEKIKNIARETWNEQLSKIQIEATSQDDKTIFYTALYHCMLMPRNRTNDMHDVEDGKAVWDDQYAVWDTWRTAFPLMSLICPEMVAGNINSFISRQKKDNQVRDAYIAGHDKPNDQGGNDIDNIIADGIMKNIKGVNWKEAYEVIKHNADYMRDCPFSENGENKHLVDKYRENGWVPEGIMTCSYTLEYAYNDYCAYLVAAKLKDKKAANKYLERSGKWINLWNENATSDGYSGFITPKTADGQFIDIDIKKDWGSWKKHFYEGNSWSYSYFMPHNFAQLVQLVGGKEKYADRLEYALENKLINYGNEPSFLTSFSFIYAGRPDLTSYWMNKLKNRGFTTKGYPGNDDSGAMSSWFIFASMGFFPNAGQDIYYLHGPSLPKTEILLSNGKKIVIETENCSKNSIYVQSCTINGKPWNKAWIRHSQLENGANIKFVMGDQPSDWAKSDTSLDLKN